MLGATALAAAGPRLRAEEPLIRWDQAVVRFDPKDPNPLALAQMYSAGRRAEAVAALEG